MQEHIDEHLDAIDEAETLLALEEAEADVANGRVTPIEIALPRIRTALGLPEHRR